MPPAARTRHHGCPLAGSEARTRACSPALPATVIQLKIPRLDAPEPLDLCFLSGTVAKAIPNRLAFLLERRQPMIMRDYPTHPLPDALFWIQLGGIGGVGFAYQAPLSDLLDRLDRTAFMLRCPGMDD
jgi:hypothetical protein